MFVEREAIIYLRLQRSRMFVLLKGLSRKKHTPGAPLEIVSAASRGISGTWSLVLHSF